MTHYDKLRHIDPKMSIDEMAEYLLRDSIMVFEDYTVESCIGNPRACTECRLDPNGTCCYETKIREWLEQEAED